MKQSLLVVVVCVLAAAFCAQTALACDTCGCKDQAASGAACESCPGGGDCASCPKAQAGTCDACLNADGGQCGQCDKAIITTTADDEAPAETCEACAASPVGMCLDCCIKMMVAGSPCMVCGSTDMCEHKQGLADRVKAKYESLNVTERELADTPVAYIATTAGGDIEGAFTSLMEQAGAQKLFGADSHFYCVYPDAMSQAYTLETPMYCSITIAPDTEVSAPAESFTVPAGKYLVVDHFGPYMELDASWIAAFAYAMQHSIALDCAGVCFEDYLNDPETTPEEELLTQIYLPLAGETVMDNPAAEVPESL